ncbi:MAG TPA: hypothetical protein VF516_09910 [Kofleriaceae bacterium]
MARGIATVSLDGHLAERARVELAGTGERILETRLGTTERTRLPATGGAAERR